MFFIMLFQKRGGKWNYYFILCSLLLIAYSVGVLGGVDEMRSVGNVNITDFFPDNDTIIGGSIKFNVSLSLNGGITNGPNVTNITFFVLNSTLTSVGSVSSTAFNQSSYSVNFDTKTVTDHTDPANHGNYSVTISIYNGTTEVNFSGKFGNGVGGSNINGSTDGIQNLTVDNTPPSVGFIFPTASFNTTTTGEYAFNFSHNDTNYISTCTLTTGRQTNTTTSFTSSNETNLTFNLGSGVHNVSVSCSDNAIDLNLNRPNGAVSSTLTITIDAQTPYTDPIEFRDTEDVSQTSFGFGDKITLDCNPKDNITAVQPSLLAVEVQDPEGGTENLTGISNDFGSLTEVVYSNTRVVGDYIVFCHLFDYLDNSNKTNKTFTVKTVVDISGGAYANPDFKSAVSTKIIGVGNTLYFGEVPTDGVSRLIAKTGSIILSVEGLDYTITVDDFGVNTVDLNINNDVTLTLNEEETKDVDVDGDGVNELSITFHQIFQKKADLTFRVVQVHATPTTPPPTEEKQAATTPGKPLLSKNVPWLGLGIGIIIVVLVALIILHFARGKRGGEQQLKFTKKDLGQRRRDDLGGDPYGEDISRGTPSQDTQFGHL